MKIYAQYFDDTVEEVERDYIAEFKMSMERVGGDFKIGRTFVNSAFLSIDKRWTVGKSIKAFICNDPSEYFIIDNVEETNDFYVRFTLVDKMILGNKGFKITFQHTESEGDKWSYVSEVLDEACNFLGITWEDIPEDIKTRKVFYSDTNNTYRDFIGWVAEVMACNALIVGNTLHWESYSTPLTHIVTEGSDFTVGEVLKIDSVNFVDIWEIGDSEGYVYNLDGNNPLTTDKDIENIYNKLKDLRYCNLDINNYMIDNILTADWKVVQGITLRYGGQDYLSFNNIEYELSNIGSSFWADNFVKTLKTRVNTKQEKETPPATIERYVQGMRTQISKNEREIELLAERVEKEEYDLGQLILNFEQFRVMIVREYKEYFDENMEEKVIMLQSLIEQTASQISLTVSTLENDVLIIKTALQVREDGVYLFQLDPSNYSRWWDQGVAFYNSGEMIAEFTATGAYCPSYSTHCWHIVEDNHINLNIFRGEVRA